MKVEFINGTVKIDRILETQDGIQIALPGDANMKSVYALVGSDENTSVIKQYGDEDELLRVFNGYRLVSIVKDFDENKIILSFRGNVGDKISELKSRIDQLENAMVLASQQEGTMDIILDENGDIELNGNGDSKLKIPMRLSHIKEDSLWMQK